MVRLPLILGVTICAASPLLAQDAPGSTPASPAPASASPPSTADLNAGVTAGLQDREAINAANRAIYEADRNADEARYEAALRAHDRAIARDDARYLHQQHAYADAMAAWRAQVASCLGGQKAACDAPPPDPGAFY